MHGVLRSTYLEKSGLDVLVIHELREDEELLAQELIGKVDGGVHDARAVGSDGVGHMADVDGIQMLIVAGALDEDLKNKEQILRGCLTYYFYSKLLVVSCSIYCIYSSPS